MPCRYGILPWNWIVACWASLAIPTAVVAATVLIAPYVAAIDEPPTVATALLSPAFAEACFALPGAAGACFALPAFAEACFALPAAAGACFALLVAAVVQLVAVAICAVR